MKKNEKIATWKQSLNLNLINFQKKKKLLLCFWKVYYDSFGFTYESYE